MQSFPSIEVTILPTERTRRNSWKLGSLMSLMCPPIFWILQSPCRVFQEVREVWQWLVDFAMDSKSESWLPSAQAVTRHIGADGFCPCWILELDQWVTTDYLILPVLCPKSIKIQYLRDLQDEECWNVSDMPWVQHTSGERDANRTRQSSSK